MMKKIGEKKYTARELAEQFGCDKDTIHHHAVKLFGPGESRKIRYFDEAQVTAILDHIKIAQNNQYRTAEGSIGSMETPLTPVLRYAQLMDTIKRAYDEALSLKNAEITRLEAAYGREVLDHKATKASLRWGD
jgi:DNA-binding transcriptional MerR regulator